MGKEERRTRRLRRRKSQDKQPHRNHRNEARTLPKVIHNGPKSGGKKITLHKPKRIKITQNDSMKLIKSRRKNIVQQFLELHFAVAIGVSRKRRSCVVPCSRCALFLKHLHTYNRLRRTFSYLKQNLIQFLVTFAQFCAQVEKSSLTQPKRIQYFTIFPSFTFCV